MLFVKRGELEYGLAENLEIEKIGLLSIEEYEKYKDDIPKWDAPAEEQRHDDYDDDYDDDEEAEGRGGDWWLMTPGKGFCNVSYVRRDGTVVRDGKMVNCSLIVRPVVKVRNLGKLGLLVGDLVNFDLFASEKMMWRMISPEHLLYEGDDIVKRFREDYMAPDANDYEKSDVKKYLAEWAKGWQIMVTEVTLLSEEEFKKCNEFIPSLWNKSWWLKNPGVYCYDLEVERDAAPYGSYQRIRPVLKASNLSALGMKAGDKIKRYAGVDWTVISQDMIIADSPFGGNVKFDETDYESSEVKRRLDSWTRENGISFDHAITRRFPDVDTGAAAAVAEIKKMENAEKGSCLCSI